MEFFSIASGSSGNCICVGSDQTHILIDVGISKKRVEAGLFQNDLSPADISAILITHEHSDHISGLGVLSRKYNIPIYTTKETIAAIKAYKPIGKMDFNLFQELEPDCPFYISDLTIHPFSISHDALNPVAYRIEHEGKAIACATDMGTYDDYTVSHLTGLDALLLEANHDVHMLQVGGYPYYLKQRILSKHGHLSNEMSGRLLNEVLHDDLKYIFLGHLSKENNYEELAYETVRSEITLGDCPYKADDFDIQIAKREQTLDKIIV